MAPGAETVRLQQLRKQLHQQYLDKKAASRTFLDQLKFLHGQMEHETVLGTGKLQQNDLDSYLSKIRKLTSNSNWIAGTVMDSDVFRSLFHAFIDLKVENMNLLMNQNQNHPIDATLQTLIESMEDSDNDLLDAWNDMTNEYLQMCDSTVKARSKQRHLAEELQEKYEKKGLEKVRKDLIIKERRHRKQYKTMFDQFTTFQSVYEEERLNMNQSFFENRRYAKSIIVNEMQAYCEKQQQLLDRLKGNLTSFMNNMKLLDSKEPTFESEKEVRPTIELLRYEPMIPTYDERGEARDITEDDVSKSSSKLNTFLHFLKKSNPGYFQSAMDTDEFSDLHSSLLSIGQPSPSKNRKKEQKQSKQNENSKKSRKKQHDGTAVRNSSSEETLDESTDQDEEEEDFEITGSQYFQDYEKNEDTEWFESFIDRIMQYPSQQLYSRSRSSSTASRLSSSPSTPTSPKRSEGNSPSDLQITTPAAFPIEEALKRIETTQGRLAFAMAMNFKRRTPQLSSVAFGILCKLIDRTMTLSYEHNDPNVGRLLLNMTQTFYTLERGDSDSQPQKLFLQTKMKGHAVWKEPRFWEGSFYDALSAERIKQMSRKKKWKNMGEEQRDEEITHHQNMVFGMLGTFSFSMLNLGLSEEVVRAFVEKMCSINSLNPEYTTQIEENVEATAMALRASHLSIARRRRSRLNSPLMQSFQTRSPAGSPLSGKSSPTSAKTGGSSVKSATSAHEYPQPSSSNDNTNGERQTASEPAASLSTLSSEDGKPKKSFKKPRPLPGSQFSNQE